MEEIKKDNGCGLNDKTERGVESGQTGCQMGSAELGKFKSVDALLQAYNALEKEFTKRSQKLKALEKEAASKAENTALDGGDTPTEQGAATGDSLGAAEGSATSERETAAPATLHNQPVQTEDCGSGNENGGAEVTTEKSEKETAAALPVCETKTAFTEDELYSAVLANETVRLKVIGEYLSSIGKSGAILTRGGTGTLAVQPAKATSVTDAGLMALRMFKNAKSQA